MANESAAEPTDPIVIAQHQALEHYVLWCSKNRLAPGIAVHAAIDFIALMVIHNHPGDADTELTRIVSCLTERIRQLAAALPEAHEPKPEFPSAAAPELDPAIPPGDHEIDRD